MAISAYPIAAAAGCFKRESGVNPGIWESLIVPSDTFSHVYAGDHIGGYGFGQFTNTYEPSTGQVAWRLRNYYDWCVSNNYSTDDGNAQLDYIINVERVWFTDNPSRLGFQSQADFWNTNSTDLNNLVYDWLSQWEGVPGNALAERQIWARNFYNYIYDHQNDDPNDYSWISGNFYTSEAQMYNNVMCMYFYLQGYTPSPGQPGDLQGFVNWCIQKCNEANIGYSQAHREEETIGGITYYDCSSFIWYGLKHNDFDIDATGHPTYAFNTTAMPTDLPLMGFIEVDRTGQLLPGDIGVTASHAEVVYEGGVGSAVFMGAHNDSLPLDEQVSINNYTTQGTDFDSIWRFRGGGPGPIPKPSKRKMPLWMMLRRLPF